MSDDPVARTKADPYRSLREDALVAEIERLRATAGACRVRTINGTGCGLRGADAHNMADFRVYEESGAVQVWAEVRPIGGGTFEALQYLTPAEAMAFAAAFERCAIQALKNA